MISKVSSGSNIFNWDVFIKNKSLTENFFVFMVLCHQKHIEYAKWEQLQLIRNLYAEKFNIEMGRNK